MRALKVLVITMGVLIVGGLMLLAWGIYTKARRVGEPRADLAAARAGFGTVELPLPAGARIEGLATTADRIVLRVVDGGGGGGGGGESERLLVIDPATGSTVGTIQVTPQVTPGR